MSTTKADLRDLTQVLYPHLKPQGEWQEQAVVQASVLLC